MMAKNSSLQQIRHSSTPLRTQSRIDSSAIFSFYVKYLRKTIVQFVIKINAIEIIPLIVAAKSNPITCNMLFNN